MPFKSEAQKKYLEIHNPSVAKEFAAHTATGMKLPEYASDGKSQTSSSERKLAAMQAMVDGEIKMTKGN